MLSMIRRLAVATLILSVALDAAAFGDELDTYGDCSDFGPLDLGEFERAPSCDAGESFECALSLALDAANGIERCDRKITALAYIGGELSKARDIHGEGIGNLGGDILAEAMNAISRVPDPNARVGPAWSIGLSFMNAGLYDQGRRVANRLSAYSRSLTLSWGAWRAALRCDENLARPLLEETQNIADSLPASAGKIRAYTWISQVHQLTKSEKSYEVLDLAETTLDEITWLDDAKSLWNARAWGKVYYTIGLFFSEQVFKSKKYLNEIEDNYQSAYVLTHSAAILAVLGKDEEARQFVVRADGLLMDYEDRYKRDALLAVLEPVRLMVGEPSRIEAISGQFSRSRAFQRMAGVLIDRRLGLLPRRCTM